MNNIRNKPLKFSLLIKRFIIFFITLIFLYIIQFVLPGHFPSIDRDLFSGIFLILGFFFLFMMLKFWVIPNIKNQVNEFLTDSKAKKDYSNWSKTQGWRYLEKNPDFLLKLRMKENNNERYSHFIEGMSQGLNFILFELRQVIPQGRHIQFNLQNIIAIQLPPNYPEFFIHKKSWWNFFIKEIKWGHIFNLKDTLYLKTEFASHLLDYENNWLIESRNQWLLIYINNGINEDDRSRIINDSIELTKSMLESLIIESVKPSLKRKVSKYLLQPKSIMWLTVLMLLGLSFIWTTLQIR